MRAVVTGCAGFIGSHLVDRLLSEGWSILGIDSLAPTYDSVGRRRQVERLAGLEGFEFIEGDINRIDLTELVGDAEVVFHLAARPGVRASWRDFATASDANILATQKVLDAVASNPDTRLVFSSSSSVYGSAEDFPVAESRPLAPISPYGVTKAACEALLSAYASQYAVSLTSLRYFTVYGPRQRSDMAFTRWIRSALRGVPLPVYGDGKAIRDFTYVDDVVDATMLAASPTTTGHRIFNVAGGGPVSVNDVIEMLGEIVGKAIDVHHTDPAKGDPARTGGDTRLIERELGWRPSTDIREGLAKQVEWARRT
jgi:nucleoside-diphosphate-sugar epimerase